MGFKEKIEWFKADLAFKAGIGAQFITIALDLSQEMRQESWSVKVQAISLYVS